MDRLLPIGEFARRVGRVLRIAFLIAGGVVLLLWAFEPTQHLLDRTRLVTNSSIYGLVGVMLAITAIALADIEGAVSRLVKRVNDFSPPGAASVVAGGVRTIYPVLDDSCLAVTAPSKRTLDVLGLTLYTAWPHLHPWVASDELRGWTIRLFCLDSGFVKANSEWFPQEWAGQSDAQVATIERFVRDCDADLRRRQVSIELTRYACFPALHGFRVGDGTLFISFIHWTLPADSSPSVLDNPHQPYVHFRATDGSGLAEAHRALFDNWLTHATASGAPVAARIVGS